MYIILASLLTASLISFFIIPVTIRIFKRRNILDAPGGRKIHTKQTPSMGGIGIFIGFFIAALIWLPIEAIIQYKYLMGALLIIFITGLRDDLISLKPSHKLAGQVISALMIVALSDIRLDSMYGLLGVTDIPEWLVYPLSVFTIIVITNSFNLIDGLDGLAGTIALVILGTLGIWFALIGEVNFSLLVFSMAGAILAFLKFNWAPSKIFMGDTGSLFIGFLLSVLVIKFINVNYQLPETNAYKFQSSVFTAITLLVVPLYDTLRVFTLRMLKKQSPFSADKNHIHHLLMRLGLKHAGTARMMGLINLIYVGVLILARHQNEYIVLTILITLTALLSFALNVSLSLKYPRRPKVRDLLKNNNNEKIIKLKESVPSNRIKETSEA